VSAFFWPLCVHVAALMLIFPRPVGPRLAPRAPSVPMRFFAAAALTALVAFVLRMALAAPISVETLSVDPLYITPYPSTIYLSAAVSLGYVFAGSFFLFGAFPMGDPRGLLTVRRTVTTVAVVLGLFGIQWVQSRLAQPEAAAPNVYTVLFIQTALVSVKLPAVFLVTHIAFYGPFVLLAIFFWKQTCEELPQGGPALPLCILVGLLLSLNSQSRCCLNLFPLLVPFVVKAIEKRVWEPRQLVGFAVIALLVSKVWFTINIAPFRGQLHEFPDQGMFMTYGPWISPTMYVAQGAAFAFLGMVLYLSWFHDRASSSRATPRSEPDAAVRTARLSA
jgi:hypothetical protein